MHELARRAATMHPDHLLDVLRPTVAALDAAALELLLVDQEQRVLLPLLGGRSEGEAIALDGTSAGRAFMTGTVVDAPTEGGTQLFVPVTNGGNRLGVAALTFPVPAAGPDERRAGNLVGWLAAQFISSRSLVTDSYQKLVRRREMDLAAELQWSLLPPLSFVTGGLAVAGALEPAYQIGGDSFDYALTGDRLDVAILDGVGHGLPACLPAAVAVSSLRHSRRHDLDLAASYRLASEAIADQFGDATFVTAAVARLTLSTGQLDWVCAGHPAPLLVRDGNFLGQLPCRPNVPLGLPSPLPRVETFVLEPGDRLLLFTDGVIEGHRGAQGPFGIERLAGLLVEEVRDDNITAETVRRLAHAVLNHHAHVLRDDFTMLLVTYGDPSADPPQPGRDTASAHLSSPPPLPGQRGATPGPCGAQG